MIEKLLQKLANFQKKYPIPIILVVLTITLFLGYYALRVETDSSFSVMYAEDSNTKVLGDLVANEFGSTDSLFVLVSIDEDSNDLDGVKDIRHPDVLKAMKILSLSLESESNVGSAQSIAGILEDIYGKLPETLEESKEMFGGLPESIKQGYLKSLMSKDYSHMLVFVDINVGRKPGTLEKIEDAARAKVEQTPFPIGTKATLIGMPILMNRIMWFLINDNINTIALAVLGVFIILWIYFKSYKIAFISTVPVILTLAWLAGTLYLMDIRITMMIASIGAMMIGMSVDYSIHLTHAFHEKIKEGDEDPINHTVVGVGSALFASVMTTIAGFLAMLLGSSPSALTQGKVLAVGIAYAFGITMIALPPLMILQRKFIYSKLDNVVFRIRGKKEETKTGLIEKLLSSIANLQVKRPWFVIGIVIVISIIMIGGFSLVYMDTEGENWLPENDEVVEGLFTMGYHFGGTDSQTILFMIDPGAIYDPNSVRDLRDPRVLQPMATLDNVIQELKWVDSVGSPTNDIKSFNNNRVPQDFETIKGVIEENPSIRSRFSEDYSIARISVRFTSAGSDQYHELLREIESIPFPHEVNIVPQGGFAEWEEMDESLMSDTAKTTIIGFLFVIIIASLFYVSIIAGLLAFVPIIFAMIWTVGTMGYINLPFTVLTTGMLSMLMGIGIDFSIHIIHSIKLKIKQLGSIEKAVPEALMSTGQAIAITTLTTIVGFMALSFANLVNTKRLGWTLAVGILATFFACMLIVPAVLTIQYRIKNKKTMIRRQ